MSIIPKLAFLLVSFCAHGEIEASRSNSPSSQGNSPTSRGNSPSSRGNSPSSRGNSPSIRGILPIIRPGSPSISPTSRSSSNSPNRTSLPKRLGEARSLSVDQPSTSTIRKSPSPSKDTSIRRSSLSPPKRKSTFGFQLECLSTVHRHALRRPRFYKTTLKDHEDLTKIVMQDKIKYTAFWKDLEGDYRDFNKLGYEQMKNLGEIWKSRYGKLSNKILATSSDKTRAQLSTQALLEGFTGNKDINVPKTSPDYTVLKCELLDTAIKHNREVSSERFQKKWASWIQKCNSWVKPIPEEEKYNANDAKKCWNIVDNVICEMGAGIKANNYNESVVKEMHRFEEYMYDFAEMQFGTNVPIVNELRIGQMLNIMVENIEKGENGSMRILGSHDITMVSLLKVLGVQPSDGLFKNGLYYPIPFGCAVVFELYSKVIQNEKKLFVRVVFNKDHEGVEVPLKFKYCEDEMCPLEIFLEHVKPFALNEQVFNEKCKEKMQKA